MSFKPKTLITAHAGAENTMPNTLESIRALAECGAEMIEVDVRGQDGQLILTHNEPRAGGALSHLGGLLPGSAAP